MLTSLTEWYTNLSPEVSLTVRCVVNMVIGGAVAIYIRELFKRCSSSLSNRAEFANIFPMLTMVTVVIIFVVKSSLALSLGLVGALSIVRFRAAIKTAEELVYLFFCIGVGISLGAEHRLLAFAAVLVVSVFVLVRRQRARGTGRNLMLTVTGDPDRFFQESGSPVLTVLEEFTDSVAIQRFDVEEGGVQFRANVTLREPVETTALMERLHKRLPKFQISYVNLETLL